jgi:hypothetical protein
VPPGIVRERDLIKEFLSPGRWPSRSTLHAASFPGSQVKVTNHPHDQTVPSGTITDMMTFMSQWLSRRSAWQYFVIGYFIAAACGLPGVMTASWSGLGTHAHLTATIDMVLPGSLVIAAGGTCGWWLRKRLAR